MINHKSVVNMGK